MDIKQLRYFAAIADEGQISRAAKKLHMAQPPLSQQLKLLEQELGVTLLARKGRELELTAPGKELYKRAKQILNLLEETVTAVKETEHGLRGVLAIGSVKSSFSYLIKRIRFFHEQYPLVTFQLREGDSFRVCELLKKRDIELGMVRLPVEMTEIHMIRLPKEPYIAVLPKHWEMAGAPAVRMKDMEHMPLLLLHRISGVGQYELVLEECRRHGFEPNVICECPDVAMLLSLVAEGVGATIVPKSSLTAIQAPNVHAAEIIDSALESESAVIWLKDRYLSKTARHFLETFEVNHLVETTE